MKRRSFITPKALAKLTPDEVALLIDVVAEAIVALVAERKPHARLTAVYRKLHRPAGFAGRRKPRAR